MIVFAVHFYQFPVKTQWSAGARYAVLRWGMSFCIISVQIEYEADESVHTSTSMVGLDAGVAKLATLSDGTIFEPVNSFKTNQNKLARLQREMSRKVKFSNNWKKAKRKVQNLHSRIGNIRRDYLHKVSTTISKSHAMIVIEDLKVSRLKPFDTGSGLVQTPSAA
ncbi:hypothetical protein SPRA44_420038 [Serratia proteamaculans]|nr:hypothetical protein SPRA44_420038 [Serratia proteamaculans]